MLLSSPAVAALLERLVEREREEGLLDRLEELRVERLVVLLDDELREGELRDDFPRDEELRDDARVDPLRFEPPRPLELFLPLPPLAAILSPSLRWPDLDYLTSSADAQVSSG